MSEPEDKAPESAENEDIEVVAHSAEEEEEPGGCVLVHWENQ